MLWDDFYDRYSDWAESTVITRISALEDIGSGEEVVDVCLNICDEKIKSRLIRRAMKLGVEFTHDDLLNLEGELEEALFEEVTQYAGFSVEALCFDEHNFEWDDFYAECSVLPEDMLLRCIPRIKKFGDTDEVVDAILSISPPADDELYNRAVACGVKFTEEQLELMGREELWFVDEVKSVGKLSDEQINDFEEQIHRAEEAADAYIKQPKNSERRKTSVGRAIALGSIIGIFKGLFGGKKKHNRRCDGNCARCPAHYGYRYGRWYYGHGHNYGCEFGGNKGGGGKVHN